jgi:paired amphipathic helix protein Sin3a
MIQRSKTAARAESPPAEDENVIMSNMPQTLASPEDVSLFDKIKKYIDDKITYHEFLKLVNLWTQNFIDLQAFIDRAHVFIGQSPELWASFRRVVNADEQSIFPNDPQSSQGGYGFGGMINVDNSVAENTPMLERVKPDLSGPRVKSYGPSYRKLPKSVSRSSCPLTRNELMNRKSTFSALVEMLCVGRSSMTNGSHTPSGPPRMPHHS